MSSLAEHDPPPQGSEDANEEWRRRWPPIAYWVKVLTAAVLTLTLFVAIRAVADILILIVMALVLAVGLDPAVEWLSSRGVRRGGAVLLICATATAVAALFGFLVVPALVHQLDSLSRDLPTYLARIQSEGGWLGDYLRRTQGVAKAQAFLSHLPQRVAGSFGTLLGFAGKVGAVVFGIVTVVILTIYFMLSLPQLRRGVTVLVRAEERDRAERVIDRSLVRIGGFFAGNIITSIVCSMASILGLVLFGVPFAIPLGLWAGIADLIPAIGSYVGAIPAIVVASFVSPLLGLAVAGFFLAYQQFENYVLAPRVMKNAVHLSPAAVILSTLVGGSLAGFAGALLALPIAATVKVIIIEIWLKDRVTEGDPLARQQLREVRNEERKARATQQARAQTRRRLMNRVLPWRRSEGPKG